MCGGAKSFRAEKILIAFNFVPFRALCAEVFLDRKEHEGSSTSRRCQLAHSRRGDGERRFIAGNIQDEAASLQTVSI